MRRREFITLLGGAAAAGRSRRVRSSRRCRSLDSLIANRLGRTRTLCCSGFRRGLKETGYVEGENVTIEYRWAENRIDRLPELADGLVRRGSP